MKRVFIGEKKEAEEQGFFLELDDPEIEDDAIIEIFEDGTVYTGQYRYTPDGCLSPQNTILCGTVSW